MKEPVLLTPGPLTTSTETKLAMVRDWGSRDSRFIEMNRRVREMRPDLPVVVCTGFAENDSLELIREDGHEVLLKPCTRHEVLRAVNRALLRRGIA